MYLQLERGVSKHTIEAYKRDIQSFADFSCEQSYQAPAKLNLDDFQAYLIELNELGIAESTQARFISSIRHFYKFLVLENLLEENPVELLEMPKLKRKLPDTLSHDDIQAMITAIDATEKFGHRNRAILEILYGCGLRVSELVNLKLSGIYEQEEFIRITGKGNKERLVPIHQKALNELNLYKANLRYQLPIQPKAEDIVFLSARGNQLSRVMIFNIVKKAAQLAGIAKNVSPHTLRHSFATELVKNGANLRAVQDMLGHASIVTTEIYTHLDRDHLKTTIEKYHPMYKK